MKPGTQLGPYEILEPLGAGGMGEVYRAHDPRLARDVALKIVKESNLERHLDRLQREARSASALNHPNVVAVYDIGLAGDVAYVAMELLEGQSLGQRLATGRLPLTEALDIACQVAEGLAAAHSRGILHRDLKPDNVMLTNEGVAKIVDFGLAKWFPLLGDDEKTAAREETLTATGAIVGTVAYMSPEQAAGRKLDFRSDQFSFGILLYELATGRRPFAGDSAAEVLAAILGKQPNAVDTLVPSLPAALVEIIDRCLAKEPRDRYATSSELARELVAVRDADTVGRQQRTGRSSNPAVWRRWALAASMILALAVIAVAVWKLGYPGPDDTAAPAPARAGGEVARSQRPAIAVLSFENLSPDPDERYFASGISEDLITRLASWRHFPVISHFSSFTFDSQPADPLEVGRNLGARYLVLGSARRIEDRVRVTARLIDASDGRVLWSDQYDRRLDDLLTLQEEISLSIVNAMYPQLDVFDQERAISEALRNLDAWDWAQRGWWHWNQGTREEVGEAMFAFQHAVDLEPRFADAYAGLALAHYTDVATGSSSPEEGIERLVSAAQTAVSQDPQSAVAQHALGHAYALTGDRERMLAAFERSLDLNPSSALVLACSGEGMALSGQHERAIRLLEEAMRLSPLDPYAALTLHSLALAHFAAERYEQAVEWANAALERQPTFAWAYRTLAASLAQLGRLEEAGRALEQAMRYEPEFTLAGGARVLLAAEPTFGDRYLEALARARMAIQQPPGK